MFNSVPAMHIYLINFAVLAPDLGEAYDPANILNSTTASKAQIAGGGPKARASVAGGRAAPSGMLGARQSVARSPFGGMQPAIPATATQQQVSPVPGLGQRASMMGATMGMPQQSMAGGMLGMQQQGMMGAQAPNQQMVSFITLTQKWF